MPKEKENYIGSSEVHVIGNIPELCQWDRKRSIKLHQKDDGMTLETDHIQIA